MVKMVILVAIKNVLTGEDNDKEGDDNDGENNGAKYWWWLGVYEENNR
jgi:hypothetical protein